MVYAHRGVDLVIAVIGTLKAGATFSVIDPLYPPERQRIYLEVAHPKALVNIRKATIDAGELSAFVRSYIGQSLQLKTEVPALYIDSKGTLSGGCRDGTDIFDSVQTKRSLSPEVITGPDSNPYFLTPFSISFVHRRSNHAKNTLLYFGI